jgi:TIR domain-containing protein
MFDVFLSYNGKDQDQAEELANRLKERSLAVWIDIWEMRPGRNWIDELHQAIQEIHAAAVLVGKYGTGPWQQQEISAILVDCVRRSKPVIPVLLPDAPAQPALPPFLAAFTWVDLRAGFSDAALGRLQWGITGIRPSRLPIGSGEADAQVMFGNPRAFHEQPFAAMVYRLEHEWKGPLQCEHVGRFQLYELTDVLVRSTLPRMRPDWLSVLGQYRENHALPAQLPEQEESALRELRNLGLIHHDGQWLFSPTRSKSTEPSAAGRFLLQLWREEPPDATAIREHLEATLKLAGEDNNRRLLDQIRRTGRFPAEEIARVRMLRNGNLVAHKAYYLADANQAMLTELAAHIVGHL